MKNSQTMLFGSTPELVMAVRGVGWQRNRVWRSRRRTAKRSRRKPDRRLRRPPLRLHSSSNMRWLYSRACRDLLLLDGRHKQLIQLPLASLLLSLLLLRNMKTRQTVTPISVILLEVLTLRVRTALASLEFGSNRASLSLFLLPCVTDFWTC